MSSVDLANSSKLVPCQRDSSRLNNTFCSLDTLVVQLSGVNLQDTLSGTLVGQWEFNLSIQPS